MEGLRGGLQPSSADGMNDARRVVGPWLVREEMPGMTLRDLS